MRRPKRTLAFVALAVLLLAGQAAQLQSRLDPPDLEIPGTEAARAGELGSESFGSQLTVPVLLRGPAPALDVQGPRLARALARDKRVTVLSPWDRTPSGIDLRPGLRDAMVVTLVRRPLSDSFDVAADVRRVVRSNVDPPVRAHVTGQAPINRAIADANFDAAKKAEMIALPVLAIVLLLVFRSPVAAAIPGLWGAATVVSGFGVTSLLTFVMTVQPLAVSLASMIGLALGIDYSLLIVSRFREELEARGDPEAAALAAVATAGRTVAFAGCVLLVALAAALLVVPGSFLLSAIVGVLVVTALAVVLAVVAMPPALALLGDNVNRWMLWKPRSGAGRRGALERFSRRVTRRAILATVAILASLLLLTVPALGLDPVAPGVSELPPDDTATRDYRTVSRVMGSGWGGPFELIAVAPSGTVADQQRLRSFQELQERLKRDPAVADVVGPGDLVPSTAPLRRLPRQIDALARSLDRGRGGIAQFETGLGRAGAGVAEL
ncbi:MAG: MMPL family transporter, partial [Actinomycetota bacterium]|nr:MMPL family transporter [Actinomycetota bacterium]